MKMRAAAATPAQPKHGTDEQAVLLARSLFVAFFFIRTSGPMRPLARR
jgi:hypothetical protein